MNMEKFNKIIYTTGAYLELVKINDDFRWVVSSFEEDSYINGDYIDVNETGKTINDVIKYTNNEKNKYENLLLKYKTRYGKEYPINSIGNIISIIDTYSNLSIAERIQVSNDDITYNGEILCKYKIDEEKYLPIFYNFNDKYEWINDNQNIFLKYFNTK